MAGSKIKSVRLIYPKDPHELQLRYAKTMAKILVDTLPPYLLKKTLQEVREDIKKIT